MRRDLSLGEFFLNTQINPNSNNIISLQHSCDIQVISWLQLARAPVNRMYLRLILGGEVRKMEVVGSVRNSPWRKGLVGEHSGNCSFLSVGWGVPHDRTALLSGAGEKRAVGPAHWARSQWVFPSPPVQQLRGAKKLSNRRKRYFNETSQSQY